MWLRRGNHDALACPGIAAREHDVACDSPVLGVRLAACLLATFLVLLPVAADDVLGAEVRAHRAPAAEAGGLATVRDNFAVNDEIRVIQNERWTLLLVTKVGVGGINLSVLLSTAVAMPDAFAPAQLPAGYEIQVSQSGELARFAVIRQSDGVQINKNLDHKTYEAARAWLTTHSIFRTNNVSARRER